MLRARSESIDGEKGECRELQSFSAPKINGLPRAVEFEVRAVIEQIKASSKQTDFDEPTEVALRITEFEKEAGAPAEPAAISSRQKAESEPKLQAGLCRNKLQR